MVVVNAGPSVASDVTVTDVLPAGVSLVSASVNPATSLTLVTAATGFTATAASLSVGTATVTLVVVSGNQGTASVTVTNVASGTSTTPDPTPTNNIGTSTVTVTASADVATVVDLPANGVAGTTVTATVTFTNNGTSTAANVTGSVVIGTSGGVITSTVVYTAGTLAPGASVTSTVVFLVPSSGPVSATSTVTTTTADPNLTNNVATDTMGVNASADVVVTKVASTSSVAAGQTYSYAVVVVNAGPSVASDVTVTDVLPAGVSLVSASVNPATSLTLVTAATGFTATAASLSVGTATVTLVVVSGNQGTASVTVTNVASGTSTTPDPTPTNNIGTSTVTVTASADVATVVDLPANGVAGTTVTATVTFTNNGTSTAANVTGSVVIGTSGGVITSTVVYTAGTLAPGASVTSTVVFLVPSSGPVSATSTVTTTTADPNLTNNVATDTIGVNASADVVVTKVASSTVGTVGQTINYVITFVNAGPSTATSVTLTDVLPTGLTLATVTATAGSLASNTSGFTVTLPNLNVGGTGTVTLTANVDAGVAASIVNAAQITSTTADPVPSNNTATSTIAKLESADVQTSVSITATPSVAEPATITVSFGNTGPSSAAGVTRTLVIQGTPTITALPPGVTTATVAGNTVLSWPATSLLGGSSTVFVVVLTTPNITTTLGVTSTIATTTPESSTANNIATAVTAQVKSVQINVLAPICVNDVPYVQYNATPIGLSASQANISFVNGAGTVVQTLTNQPLSGQILWPGAAVNGSGQGTAWPGWSFDGAHWNFDPSSPLLPTLTVLITINPTGSATVSYPPATAACFAGPNADVISTIVVGTGTAGTTVNATATFSNAGPSTATDVTTTLRLTPGLASVTVTHATITGAYNSVTGIVTLAGVTSTFAPGMTITIGLQLGTPGGFTQVGGTTTITTTLPEHNTVNNVASAMSPLNTLADVSVTLSAPAAAAPGTTATAIVKVVNLGPSTAANVTATVTLPNGSSTTVFTIALLTPNSTQSVTVTYVVPPAQSVAMNWTATVATTSLESSVANNTTTGVTNVTVVTNASLSGRVWYDINRNRVFDNTTSDAPLEGFRVELFKVSGTTTAIVGTATTGADGRYTISGQVPGPDYGVRFRDPLGNVIYGTPFNQKLTTQNSNPSTGTNVLITSVSQNQSITATGYIGNVTLYAGDNVQEQNLPLDPSGIVYDSVARTPIPGATVKLVGPAGFDPAKHLLSGTDTQITPAFGLYQFLFINVNDADPANRPPAGVYTLQVTPPGGYAPPVAVQGGVTAPTATPFNVPAGVTNIQAQATPPAQGVNGPGPIGGTGTQYFFQLQFNFPGSGEVFNNHIPLDPLASGAILVNKTGNKTVAEVGDSVQYTIRMRNTTGAPIAGVTLEDLLPAGFRYILETTRLNGATVTNPAGGVGRALTFNIGTIPANTVYELTYFVRLGVGSQQGDGINRATAVFPGAGGAPVRSNTALFKVNVQGGVFSNDGCIVGKVYVDCDGNFVQNNDGGSREVGIPGVRLVMLDGSWIITDNEGKYSICGVKAQTQVIKIDRTTLPKGSRMVPSSNRNAGVGDSLFVDMKGGEMHRADFIEGSCSPEVMDQIKARRAQGGVSLPDTDKDNKAVKPDYRPAETMPAVPGGVR